MGKNKNRKSFMAVIQVDTKKRKPRASARPSSDIGSASRASQTCRGSPARCGRSASWLDGGVCPGESSPSAPSASEIRHVFRDETGIAPSSRSR